MSGLKIDYGALGGLVDGAEEQAGRRRGRRGRFRRLPIRLVRAAGVAAALAILPFGVLLRGGVFAYREWALGTWPSLGLAVAVTTLVLLAYAWLIGRKLGAGRGLRRALTRGAVALAGAYVAYALVYVGGANVKSTELRAEYVRIHPLLRIASSALIVVDPSSVITDAGRTEDDYFLMGLPLNEASLHFTQDDGFVHAIDFRTRGRPEWRNRAVELGFWAMGFHSLRHVGTADHLHVSLRLPRRGQG